MACIRVVLATSFNSIFSTPGMHHKARQQAHMLTHHRSDYLSQLPIRLYRFVFPGRNPVLLYAFLLFPLWSNKKPNATPKLQQIYTVLLKP
jgi:hypothetical protein